jgi:hypothetical protein
MNVFLVLSWFWLGYIAMVKPFQKAFVWYFELFNELCVLVVCLQCWMQLSIENDAWGRVYIGYSLEWCLLVQLALNMLAVTFFRVKFFHWWLKSKIRLARHKAH